MSRAFYTQQIFGRYVFGEHSTSTKHCQSCTHIPYTLKADKQKNKPEEEEEEEKTLIWYFFVFLSMLRNIKKREKCSQKKRHSNDTTHNRERERKRDKEKKICMLLFFFLFNKMLPLLFHHYTHYTEYNTITTSKCRHRKANGYPRRKWLFFVSDVTFPFLYYPSFCQWYALFVQMYVCMKHMQVIMFYSQRATEKKILLTV